MNNSRTFTVSKREVTASAQAVVERLNGVKPERVDRYYVEIAGVRFPAKQAVCVGLGLSRADVNSHQAVRILRALGFDPVEA